MGRLKTTTNTNRERATKLVKEMGGTTKYTVSYIMWFIKEWEEITGKLRNDN